MEPQSHPTLLSLLGLAPQPGIAPVGPSRQICTRDERFTIWSAARAEANIAYEAWGRSPSPDTYAVYRAAEDRADAAEDALAELDALEFPRAA
jgi:hypothetical protein